LPYASPVSTFTLIPPSETPTVTPPATGGYLSELEFKQTSAIEGYEYGKGGPKIDAAVSVDQSAGGHGFSEVIMPDKMLGQFTLRALHSMFAPTEPDDKASLDAFAAKWAAAQNGGEPLNLTINTFDANKKSEKAEPMTLVFAGDGAVLPEGSIVIKKVNFVVGAWYENPEMGVFVSGKDTPWFKMASEAGVGFGVMVDKSTGEIYLFVGVNYLADESNRQISVGAFMNELIKWLSRMGMGLGPKLEGTKADHRAAEQLISEGLIVK
jgi:hypothetical protein